MPRILSPAAARSILSCETDEIWMCAMRITHPSIATIRIVNDSVEAVRADGIYTPWAFEPILPNDTADANATVTVTMDNVDRDIVKLLRTITGEPPKCTLEVVLASQPDEVELGPFEFSILQGQSDITTLQLSLGYEEDFLNQGVPAQSYNPTSSPGLFV